MSTIIFSINEQGSGPNYRARKQFLRHIDNLRALGKMKGEFRTAVLCQRQGSLASLRPAYLMDREDYRKNVMPGGWALPTAMQLDQLALTEINPATLHARGDASMLMPCGGVMPAGEWLYLDDPGEFWAII